MAKWTAADWDRRENAVKMLDEGPAIKRRKLRLFSVALCNRFRQYVEAPSCLAALAAAERDADEPLDKDELRALRTEADAAAIGLLSVRGSFRDMMVMAAHARAYAIHSKLRVGARQVSSCIVTAACWQEVPKGSSDRAWQAVSRQEDRIHADLLRHIVGNPFRPFPAPPALPAAVVQLAAALEAGDPVAFALRDALLEAGQTELAEHFAGQEPHPRGCWALDVIGGRA